MVRISGLGPSSGVGAAKKGAKKKAKASGSSKGGGQVKVADATSLREKAKAMLADMPEVRMEQIESIRDALERGEYHVDGERVAERIIANALAERPW